jgi:ankyrin repeat protein
MNEWLELLKNNDYLNIKKYIKNGANVNEANENGESVLASAIRNLCDMEILMLLVDNKADIFDIDENGVSIFDMAITYNNIEMVKYIIDHGADVNRTNRRSGFTALMAAACYGREEITKILLSQGANQNTTDMKGFTAVDFARKMNKKSILKLLEYDENSPINTNYAR